MSSQPTAEEVLEFSPVRPSGGSDAEIPNGQASPSATAKTQPVVPPKIRFSKKRQQDDAADHARLLKLKTGGSADGSEPGNDYDIDAESSDAMKKPSVAAKVEEDEDEEDDWFGAGKVKHAIAKKPAAATSDEEDEDEADEEEDRIMRKPVAASGAAEEGEDDEEGDAYRAMEKPAAAIDGEDKKKKRTMKKASCNPCCGRGGRGTRGRGPDHEKASCSQ